MADWEDYPDIPITTPPPTADRFGVWRSRHPRYRDEVRSATLHGQPYTQIYREPVCQEESSRGEYRGGERGHHPRYEEEIRSATLNGQPYTQVHMVPLADDEDDDKRPSRGCCQGRSARQGGQVRSRMRGVYQHPCAPYRYQLSWWGRNLGWILLAAPYVLVLVIVLPLELGKKSSNNTKRQVVDRDNEALVATGRLIRKIKPQTGSNSEVESQSQALTITMIVIVCLWAAGLVYAYANWRRYEQDYHSIPNDEEGDEDPEDGQARKDRRKTLKQTSLRPKMPRTGTSMGGSSRC